MFKHNVTKRKAFTLIELLIVIAIIGILFIVLVSKVDFASDKAKATGVQTDFRSFQLAFETVSRENAGFNTFGWDTGDLNANGKRDSYDEGDVNKDNIQNNNEIWTGHKVPGETFTNVFTLIKPGTSNYDRTALSNLESAINANLDPKLHITIADDGTISMANGAKDPWNKEYHGYYITNAEVDKKDRGAIVMYSDGANNEFGSEHKIANGVVSISIPGNNKYGKDDYSVAVIYTYMNGYGEVKTTTSGFSNNQSNGSNGNGESNVPNDTPTDETPGLDGDGFTQPPDIDLGEESDNYAGITLQTPYVLDKSNAVIKYEISFVFYEESWTFFINGTHGVNESSIRPMGKAEYYDSQIKLYTAMGIDHYDADVLVLDVNEDESLTFNDCSSWSFTGNMVKTSNPYFNIPTNTEIGSREPVGAALAFDYTDSYSTPNLLMGDGYNGNIVYYPYNREVVGNKYPVSNGRIIIDNETIRTNWVDCDFAERHKEFSIQFNSNDGVVEDITELHTSVGHIFYDNTRQGTDVAIPNNNFPGMNDLSIYNGVYIYDMTYLIEDQLTNNADAYPEHTHAYFNYYKNLINNKQDLVQTLAVACIVEDGVLKMSYGTYWREFNAFVTDGDMWKEGDLLDCMLGRKRPWGTTGDQVSQWQYQTITFEGNKLIENLQYQDGFTNEYTSFYQEIFIKENVRVIDGSTINEYVPVKLTSAFVIDGPCVGFEWEIIEEFDRITKNSDGTYHCNLVFANIGWEPIAVNTDNSEGLFGDFELYQLLPLIDFADLEKIFMDPNCDWHQMFVITYIPADFID